MPHGWKHYEGKTYAKIGGQFREIYLKDLFPSESQREFLRDYCESALKKESLTYFGGENPLRLTLDPENLETFMVNDQYLIVIFQPYVAVSSADSPFIVKIPFHTLQGHWDSGSLLVTLLNKTIESKNFVTSEEVF